MKKTRVEHEGILLKVTGYRVASGGVQDETKRSIGRALLDRQREQFAQIAQDHLAAGDHAQGEPVLSAQIAIFRESINQPDSVARAVLAALVESPELLDDLKAQDTAKMEKLQAEARDVDLSLLRYFAASGIAFSTLLGLSAVPDALRERLFDRLPAEKKW